MNSREKLLILLVGAVVALFGVKLIYDQVAGMFDDNERALAAVNEKIKKSEADVAAGKAAAKRISDWEKQSLPSDRQTATRLYELWLFQLATKYGFSAKDVHLVGSTGRASNAEKQGYDKLGFEVKGVSDVTIKQLVDFMYEFYASNQLHKIKTLDITPTNDGKQADIKMTIEAMVLPGAVSMNGKPRRDKLSDIPAKALLLGNVAAYEKVITGRSLFEPYKPPVPVGPIVSGGRVDPPKPPPFDVAKYTKLTGIVAENDDPRIFVSVQPTGEEFKGLKVDDEFTVGGVKYKVVSIGEREAILTTEGKRKQIGLGGNLRDAVDLPDEPGL